jgi:diguanylate cyclase (GGDEF)-like protein/putative nucleotidyltransferase with HDIG domain
MQLFRDAMSTKTKTFVMITAALGLAHIAFTAANWHISDAKRFWTYLAMAVFCSVFQVKRSGLAIAFSLNLPFILISLVELTMPEAVAIGCAAALAQCLWDAQTRRRPSQILFTVTVLATIIASAGFAYDSLLPKALQSATIRLFVAASAFFVANTLPAAITLRFTRKERLGQLWKNSYFWSFPYYLVAAAMAGVVHMSSTTLSLDTALLALPVVYVAYRYYRVQKSQLEEQQKHAGDMAALHLRAIEGLALAVEAKDNLNTRGHLRRVQVYALEVGKDLGLAGEELEALHAAALLHDIGKLAVPEHILTKPGKLTPEEFAKMKVHPVVGAEIVEQVQFPYPVAPIVAAHHEKWDGNGYPFALQGEAIPLGARILSAVDCLDALTSDREYRRGVTLEEAMKHISAESGRSFDPKVVAVLERRYHDLERLAKAQGQNTPTLSTNAVIRNGHAPASGLDLSAGAGSPAGEKPLDFLGTIAAARREGRFLLEMAEGVGNSLDLDTTLSRVEESLKAMIPHNALAVFVQRANTLAAQYAAGDNAHILSYLEVPVGEGLAGWVAENAQPVVNGNPAVEPGFVAEARLPLCSALAVPLEGSNGMLGVMVLYHRNPDAFTRDHLRMLLAVIPKIGQAVQNALKYRETEERANTDRATELPNAALLTQSLEVELVRARRLKQPLVVMYCNVDGVQQVYSEVGAPEGDDLVRGIAHSLKQDCREYDHIARVGTGEFAIVLPGMKRDALGAKVARLGEVAEEAHSSHRNTIAFCIGQAFYPDDGDSARLLLAVAKRRTSQQRRKPADVAQQPPPRAQQEQPAATDRSARLAFKDRWAEAREARHTR